MRDKDRSWRNPTSHPEWNGLGVTNGGQSNKPQQLGARSNSSPKIWGPNAHKALPSATPRRVPRELGQALRFAELADREAGLRILKNEVAAPRRRRTAPDRSRSGSSP